mmetsp:Transcript_32400/g.95484  ORF Transcript_32400/g.95484 Transcript_32400/m.95484 type:complete len:293 (+) Transcript_32400:932-1810(+)
MLPRSCCSANCPRALCRRHQMPRSYFNSMRMEVEYYWERQRNSLWPMCTSRRIECGQQAKAEGTSHRSRFTTSFYLLYVVEQYQFTTLHGRVMNDPLPPGSLIRPSCLLCTRKGILQNLNKLSLDGRGGGRSYVFTVDADHKFSLASSKYRCLFKRGNDLLFLSSGREIRVFDRRGDVSSPFVFSAESSITSMFADNTKLVCATKHPNGRSGRMEVFHLDIFTQTMFASLVVKKTFQSQHTMHSPQLNGRYLSIGYSYDGERAALGAGRFASSYFTVGGEMQVFDLLRLEGK